MTTIDSLYIELDEARARWIHFYDLLKQGQYETNEARQALENASVDDLHARTLMVFDLLYALKPTSEDGNDYLFLAAYASEFSNLLINYKNQAQSALNQLTQHWQDDVVIKDGNNNFAWQLYRENSNFANIDVSANFTALNSSIKQLLTQTSLILPICKANATADLTKRVQALTEVVRETESQRNEARRLLKATDQSATAAAEKDKKTAAILAQVEAIHTKLQALQQQTDRESSSITALVAQIKTTGANADTLEQQIVGYQSKFDAFQSQLDSKIKLFSDFETFVKQAEKDNRNREDEIDRLTEKADTMIRGATTAGLSKSLEDTRDTYSKKMEHARKGFYFSIGFLTLSALPLAAHLLPGLVGNWIPAISEQAQNSQLGVIGKIFLLLPATWLTVFFTKSFAEFFHLEREYAHKAALAKSVEGFKREAPKYQEEITSSVFGEILNNPSKGKSPEPANHPLYEVLTKRLFEWFGKKD